MSIERGFGVEPPVIERAAGDRAFELLGARLEQRAHVVDRGEPARGDHRNRDRVGERDGGVEVEPLQHAVALDVGIDDRGDAGILEAPRDVERRHFRVLRPALHRHLAVARIEPDRDARRDRAPPLPARSTGSRTAAVPMITRLTPLSSQLSTVAMSRMPPPSCTRDIGRLQDALDGDGVDRLAGEGAVEIDDMQIFEARALEGMGLLGRIAVEDRSRAPCRPARGGRRRRPSDRWRERGSRTHAASHDGRPLAYPKSHRSEAELYGFHLRKLAISAKPSRWLFSGWNCVPAMLSRATMAVTGPP